jgi:hypothetical protein
VYILILGSCQSGLTTSSHQSPDYVKKAHAITAQVARKIQQETGLRLIGTGGGMMDHIRMMAMSFAQYGVVTMEEGRELVIYCVQEYLAAINGCEEIRDNLAHYPFTPRDIEIAIFIRGPKNEDVPIGEFNAVGIINGILDYNIEQSGFPSMKKIHKETYDEAVKIIQEKDPDMRLIKKKQK